MNPSHPPQDNDEEEILHPEISAQKATQPTEGEVLQEETKRVRIIAGAVRALTVGRNALLGTKEKGEQEGNPDALAKINDEEYQKWDSQMTMLSIGGELSIRIVMSIIGTALAMSEAVTNDPELASLINTVLSVLIVMLTAIVVAITSLHFIKDSILSYQANPEDGLINARIGINMGSVLVDIGSLVGGAVLPNPRIFKLFFKGGKLGKAAALSERAEGVVADVLERECHGGVAAAHRKSMMATLTLGLVGGASGLSIGDTESLMSMGRELALYVGIVRIAGWFNNKSQEVINATYSKRFADATEKMIKELEEITEFGNVRETIKEQMLARAVTGDEMNEIEIMASVLGSILNRLKTLLSEGAWRAGFQGIEAEEGEAAFVFTDIKGFSKFTVKLKKRIFAILNRYFDQNLSIFRKFNGDIDKLIGDAIFAVFPDENDAFDAVLEMLSLEEEVETSIIFPMRDIYQLEESDDDSGETAIGRFETRIGLHRGAYSRGSVGAEGRRENSHFGDDINKTARLEPLGDVYGVKINLSEEIYSHLSPDRQAKCRLIDRIAVKGREKKPFELYTVDINPQVQTDTAFQKAFSDGMNAYLHGNWEKAIELLHHAQELYPLEGVNDGPTACLIKRIEGSRQGDLDMLKRAKIRGYLSDEEYEEKVRRAMQADFEPPENFIYFGIDDDGETDDPDAAREKRTTARLEKKPGYWKFSTKS